MKTLYEICIDDNGNVVIVKIDKDKEDKINALNKKIENLKIFIEARDEVTGQLRVDLLALQNDLMKLQAK